MRRDSQSSSGRAGRSRADPELNNKVKNSLDRLAFAAQTGAVKNALKDSVLDAVSETGGYLNLASEGVFKINAARYASQWTPTIDKLGLKQTYVKVSAEACDRIKFYEEGNLKKLVDAHTRERETVLSENAALRSMLKGYIPDLESSSKDVAEIKETEDGVNRALLMSAMEEITRLKTREQSLERDLATMRVGKTFGAVTGADSSREGRLTHEVERLQEDNERKDWMIKEKQKEIDEVKGRYKISRARKLEEQFQELCESLQSTVKTHDQIVEVLGGGLKAKLDVMADQIEDLTEEVHEKQEKFNVLKDAVLSLLRDNDTSQVPVISGICRFTDEETAAAENGVNDRSSRTIVFPRLLASPINAIVGPLLKNVGVCAPPVRSIRGAATPPTPSAGGTAGAAAQAGETPPASPSAKAPGVMDAPGADPITPPVTSGKTAGGAGASDETAAAAADPETPPTAPKEEGNADAAQVQSTANSAAPSPAVSAAADKVASVRDAVESAANSPVPSSAAPSAAATPVRSSAKKAARGQRFSGFDVEDGVRRKLADPALAALQKEMKAKKKEKKKQKAKASNEPQPAGGFGGFGGDDDDSDEDSDSD